MPSAVTFLGHPVHPMLIVFPLGLLITSLAGDVVAACTRDRFWYRATYYVIFAGVLGGTVAAIPGLLDYLLAVPKGTDLGEDALIHGLLNATALALFTVNLFLRRRERAFEGPVRRVALALTVIGVALLAISGRIGGEMVFEHGMGVVVEPEEHEPTLPPGQAGACGPSRELIPAGGP